MEINKIGVVGAGLMGSGIAQVCAGSGYQTAVHDISDDILECCRSSIWKALDRAVEKSKLTREDAEQVRARLSFTQRLEDLGDSCWIIEAASERFEVKKEVFERLERVSPPSTVFASNTSSLSITDLMTTCQRPERFLGLHFFNPVPVMKLVEVIRTIATSEQVVEQAVALARSLGKEPVQCEDRPGFLVNRLLVPYLLDAIRALEEGVGGMEDIDRAMKLGCGHPMGPFQLLDFVGLDTTLHIANIMFDEFKEKRFAPPPSLKRMVLAGRLGRKSGRGFYDYNRGS
jgi:3-hydroxybutyryl-CoA dehydrogenase